MVDHIAWVGRQYQQGRSGQKIAIAGYSHWGSEADHELASVQCVANVRDGTWPCIRFFNAIRSYFGGEAADVFWDTVLFFNFVPDLIGDGEDRYRWAGLEQKMRGQKRVLRIVTEHRPEKLFVFSRKAWCSFPPTIDEQQGHQCQSLGHGCPPAFTFGRYAHEPVSETSTLAVGLRHPQYANITSMQHAVDTVLNL